jgi:hypothetical protein
MATQDEEVQVYERYECPRCYRTAEELDDAYVGWDPSVFAECEECDPEGESEL